MAVVIGHFLAHELFAQSVQLLLLSSFTDAFREEWGLAYDAIFQCFCPAPMAIFIGLVLTQVVGLGQSVDQTRGKRLQGWLIPAAFGFVGGLGAYIPQQVFTLMVIVFSG